MPGRMLAVFQRAWIATGCASFASLLDLFIGSVRKTQHELAEAFAEPVFFGQQLERVFLVLGGRLQYELSIPCKHCTGHFSIHRCGKAHRSRVQVERASAEFVTYWITVQNLTAVSVNFEGRFEILSRY